VSLLISIFFSKISFTQVGVSRVAMVLKAESGQTKASLGSRFSVYHLKQKYFTQTLLRRRPDIYVEPPDVRLVASPRLFRL